MKKVYVIPLVAAAIASIAYASVTALQEPEPVQFYACVDTDGTVQSGTLRMGSAPTCKKGSTVASWNNIGPQGAQGVQGAQGPAGPSGPSGATGPAGAPGAGVLRWFDANGNAAATIVFGTNQVALNIEGVLVAGNLDGLFDAPLEAVWFAPDRAVSYESPDCTGIGYHTQWMHMQGLVPTVQFRDPDSGQALLVRLDPNSIAERTILSQRYLGACNPTESRMMTAAGVSVHNLSELYPEPLTLH